MLDIKYIREHTAEIKENIRKRRMNVDIDRLLELDEQRRELMTKRDELRAQKNKGSKGKPSPEEIEHMKQVGERIANLDAELNTLEPEYHNVLFAVPNLSHPEVPDGGEEDFHLIEIRGKEPQFTFAAKDHEQLLSEKGLLDFERGAKVVGSKHYYLKGDLVRLNQALVQYGIDKASAAGFELLETPDMVREHVLEGAGFNPRGEEDQIYTIENSDLALIGTAEISTLGYHANDLLDLQDGPKKYVAISHCFRKEGGSYGRVSKGLYRVHQFSKVELFVFCKPEDSERMHQELLELEKNICDGLGLHYRIIDIASADLGAPAYRKFDLEAWMTMKGDDSKVGDFGEITSTSNCLDYQARRLQIKYKKEDGSTDFVHTLNGTAIVLTRFPLAIVEQYQQEDGSIHIPEVLRPYMGNKEFIA